MGPPGAGKGTQGDRLAERFEVPRLSTGDMLREARREGSDLGREARRYMDAGELVPDGVILGLIRRALDAPRAGRGFVLDGFPRTIAQAEGLDAVLGERGDSLDAVVDLRVPEDELVRRLSGRRICEACGEVTHVDVVGEGGSCARCGGALTQRSDDRPETVRRRLQVYRAQTEPVLARYRAGEAPVLPVEGTGSIDEVTERLVAALAGSAERGARRGPVGEGSGR